MSKGIIKAVFGVITMKMRALFGKIKPRKIRNEKVIQGGTIINEGRQFQADLVIEGEDYPNPGSGSGNTASGSSGNRCQPLLSLFRG